MSTTTLDALMAQAQVFASAWSLVGSNFDSGSMIDDAEAAKAELRAMLSEALADEGQPAEPVSAEYRFAGQDWGKCSVAHARAVLASPNDWRGCETRLLYAAAPPVAPAAPVAPQGWREAVQRLVTGFEHVSGIARNWEPDHSSGADRAKWARATEACADVAKLLAAAPPAPAAAPAEGARDAENARVAQALEAASTAMPEPRPQKHVPAEGARWLPIESAPKDGTYFMASNKHGVWVASHQQFSASGYRFDNPWRSMMLNHWHIQPKDAQYEAATHWAPLPAAPTEAPNDQA